MRLLSSATALFLFSTFLCPACGQDPQKPPETSGAQTLDTKGAPDSATPAPSPASVNETTVLIKEGTPVRLKLLHTLNSKTIVLDDPLNFSLAEDLFVDSKPLLKAGAPAIGRVRQAKAARTLGRGAEIGLEMQYLKAGRTRVPLRGSQTQQGEGKTGDTVALTVLFGINGLLKHGSEITVKEGSLFTAYVDHDTVIPVLAAQSGSPKE